MQVIVKKIPARTVRSYQCGVCRITYRSRAAALECEAGGTEPLMFRKGDRVRARERRACPTGKDYVCRGVIAAVSKPVRYDPEIFMKGHGVAGRHGHLRWYAVAYVCPVCGEKKSAAYPAGALRRA